MAKSQLEKAISQAANDFALQIIEAVKASTLEELLALQNAEAPKKRGRKPGRPPKSETREPPRNAVGNQAVQPKRPRQPRRPSKGKSEIIPSAPSQSARKTNSQGAKASAASTPKCLRLGRSRVRSIIWGSSVRFDLSLIRKI